MKEPLVHEMALAFFLALTTVRLMADQGPFGGTALSFLVLLGVSAADKTGH